ncbi:MAG TPA: SUMF1/EgtB/PvdO family nonheme iron enzyme, partial [Isosphaeraceae bacterium]|nr:SUMF1/EgtB/PvdO family nonheme iron enzyme [Isosphaeraceae bacterium]
LPNDAGLFDMLGNAGELCHDVRARLPAGPQIVDDTIADENISNEFRSIRGGSFAQSPAGLLSGYRAAWCAPSDPLADIGFRLARTIP